MSNGFPKFLYFCALHGASAVHERVVNAIEEFNEYKAWLAKNKQEAQKAHPSSPIVSLFDGT